MAHHNDLIGHTTSPDWNKTKSLTPQNQPERPLLRGILLDFGVQCPGLFRPAVSHVVA